MLAIEKCLSVLNSGFQGRYSRDQAIQLRDWMSQLAMIEIESIDNQLNKSNIKTINNQENAA